MVLPILISVSVTPGPYVISAAPALIAHTPAIRSAIGVSHLIIAAVLSHHATNRSAAPAAGETNQRGTGAALLPSSRGAGWRQLFYELRHSRDVPNLTARLVGRRTRARIQAAEPSL